MKWVATDEDGYVESGLLAVGGQADIPWRGYLWFQLGDSAWLKIHASEWGWTEIREQGPNLTPASPKAYEHMLSPIKHITGYIQTKTVAGEKLWSLVHKNEASGFTSQLTSVLQAARLMFGRGPLNVWDCDKSKFTSKLLVDETI